MNEPEENLMASSLTWLLTLGQDNWVIIPGEKSLILAGGTYMTTSKLTSPLHDVRIPPILVPPVRLHLAAVHIYRIAK